MYNLWRSTVTWLQVRRGVGSLMGRLRSSGFSCKPWRAVQRGGSGIVGAPGNWHPGNLLSCLASGEFAQPLSVGKGASQSMPRSADGAKTLNSPPLPRASQCRPLGSCGICCGSPTASNNLGNLKHGAASLPAPSRLTPPSG